jgi:hypothetical protein
MGGSLAAVSEIAAQGGTPPSLNSQVLPFAHRGISRAVALGWQVAQLFHSPVHQGPVTDPPRGGHLPGRSEFPGASQSTCWGSRSSRSWSSCWLTRRPCSWRRCRMCWLH